MSLPNSKRALRRHHRDRYRQRNRRNYPHWSQAWMFGDTRQRCSCMGCGHQRMWHGPKIQERRECQGQAGAK